MHLSSGSNGSACFSGKAVFYLHKLYDPWLSADFLFFRCFLDQYQKVLAEESQLDYGVIKKKKHIGLYSPPSEMH